MSHAFIRPLLPADVGTERVHEPPSPASPQDTGVWPTAPSRRPSIGQGHGVRVGAAGALGLYPSTAIFGLSVAAVVPAVLGVATGRQLRHRVSSRHREIAVLGMLTVIGVRLVLGGLGIA